jgi:pyruvate-ferredoxin/flavodoxin oxidoreductase
MNKSMLEMRKAVRAGYWNLLRYNPDLAEPLSLDSGAPSEAYRDFLMGEVRYNSLKLRFPEEAEKLFTSAEKTAMERYDTLKRKAEADRKGE